MRNLKTGITFIVLGNVLYVSKDFCQYFEKVVFGF